MCAGGASSSARRTPHRPDRRPSQVWLALRWPIFCRPPPLGYVHAVPPWRNARVISLAALAAIALCAAGCGGGSQHRHSRPPIVATPDVGGRSVPTPSAAAMERAMDVVYRSHAADAVGVC